MGILGNVAAGLVRTALLPVAIAADVVTMFGAMTETDEPYTASAFKGIANNVSNVIDGLEK